MRVDRFLITSFVLQFILLIDGMISECGSEVERLAKELEESRAKSSQLDGKLKVIEDARSLEASRFESRIAELERDLGKTASLFLRQKRRRRLSPRSCVG